MTAPIRLDDATPASTPANIPAVPPAVPPAGPAASPAAGLVGPANAEGGPGGHGAHDIEAADAPPGEFFRRIYQVFYSKTVGLITILALAVLILIGALVVQTDASTYDDATAKAEFLAEMRAKYGGWTTLLNALGLFHVFSSIGFLVLVGLLAASIVACTTHRLPRLWEGFRHPKTHPSDQFFDRARYQAQVTATEPPSVATADVTNLLSRLHYRVVPDGANQQSLYADRFAWGGFGTVVAHLSFLVILAAFVISASTGVDEVRSLPVGGAAVAVGHDSGLEIAATNFEATYSDAGQPLDYVSHLVVTRDGVTVAEQDVRVNEPLRYGGYKFHQNSYGLAADIKVTGPDGAALVDQSVPLQWTTTDGTAIVGTVELPGTGLAVDVFLPASGSTDSGIEPGNAVLRLVQTETGETLQMSQVQPGQPLAVGDYSLTFVRERQITGVLVRRDPGALWMWLGSILLVAAMCVTFACRPRRYWLRITPAGTGATVRMASSDKADSAYQRHFNQLAAQISQLFAGPDTDSGPAPKSTSALEPEPEPDSEPQEATHA
ncbi:MAG: cytochrome c biogenesis protein ResB [Bifidobacteriaceae bacterium]|jgi:cytochrome c biogenesis protein|nr:cytochrome c biogenesis protein ResB [Bifidobacteriaceae bacterium]